MEPSENLGLYWYVIVCMFKHRISFLRWTLFLMQFAECIFVSLMISHTNDMLDWVAEGKGGRKIDARKA